MDAPSGSAQVDVGRFKTDDGVAQLIAFLRDRLNITEYHKEIQAFETYFKRTERRPGESMNAFKNEE